MNYELFSFIHSLAGQYWWLDYFGIFLAKYFPYFLGTSVLILIFKENNWRRRWLFFSQVALSLILSRGILTEAIRFIYFNPRPFIALNFTPLLKDMASSFPSGHAAFFFALAGVVLFWRRRYSWIYFLGAGVIGIARIFAGVHWPMDILGGVVTGVLSAVLVKYVLEPKSVSWLNKEMNIGSRTAVDPTP